MTTIVAGVFDHNNLRILNYSCLDQFPHKIKNIIIIIMVRRLFISQSKIPSMQDKTS